MLKPYRSPHFLHSLRCALHGLGLALRVERNIRTHAVLACLAVALGVYVRLERVEWILLLLCIGLMLAVELLNTALEHLVDELVGDTLDERARRVKDISAGACLLTAFVVGVIGLLVFVPHFFF
jgi:diacylglycerol kinase